MLHTTERDMIARLWNRKLAQDAQNMPRAQRHRNLEPTAAEVVAAMATGMRAQSLVEVGGSSGISTIALAAAARATGGRLVSIEIEPIRQAEARATITELGLAASVEFISRDAGEILPGLDLADFALLDCEKEDYVRFFELLRLAPGAVVVADNIISHDLAAYVDHVRARPGAESVTLAVGKGLEITRMSAGSEPAA